MQWAIGQFVGSGAGGIVVWYNKIVHEGIRKKALRKMEREVGKKRN